MGMCGVQLVGIETEPSEGAGPVAKHHDVRGRREPVHLLERGCVAEFGHRGALAGAGVDVLVEELGHPRRVDSQHVRPERGEELGRGRAGDHPCEVEHPNAVGSGPLVTVAKTEPDPGLGGDGAALRGDFPVGSGPERGGDATSDTDRPLCGDRG
jgi:hypothetical protein